MDRKYKVGGYVKLAKLWERSKDAAVAYHSSYYAEKFRDDADKRLVGVYIDITGNTGEMKKKQMKFFPDAYKNRIGKAYNDYIADHQMNMFEDFIGYQSSTVLDEPEREAVTTSIPIPQREESENIPLPDLPGQLENVQQSGNEIAERGMQT